MGSNLSELAVSVKRVSHVLCMVTGGSRLGSQGSPGSGLRQLTAVVNQANIEETNTKSQCTHRSVRSKVLAYADPKAVKMATGFVQPEVLEAMVQRPVNPMKSSCRNPCS